MEPAATGEFRHSSLSSSAVWWCMPQVLTSTDRKSPSGTYMMFSSARTPDSPAALKLLGDRPLLDPGKREKAAFATKSGRQDERCDGRRDHASARCQP